MNIDYRSQARRALRQAHGELEAGGETRLRSAALQLRMAMEAVTYDRARAYADDFPPEEYATWQPKRVMRLLLAIDGNADADSSLAIGVEETYGQPAKEMTMLGTEKVLNLAAIKKHYDALGSFLHMPTWKQMQEGKSLDMAKLDAKCREIAAELEAILSSSVWNLRFGVTATTACVYCDKQLRRRVPKEGESVQVKCFECGALYLLKSVDHKTARLEPIQTEVSCPTHDCGHKFCLGSHEVKRGACWTCPRCNRPYAIDLAVVPVRPDSTLEANIAESG